MLKAKKLWHLIGSSLLLMCTGVANAGIAYDNGDANSADVGFMDQVNADDFVLSEEWMVTGFSVQTAFFDRDFFANGRPGNAGVYDVNEIYAVIYDDNAGVPGTASWVDYILGNTATITSLGTHPVFGVEMFEVYFELTVPQVLAAGTYWFTSFFDNSDEVYWLGTTPVNGNIGVYEDPQDYGIDGPWIPSYDYSFAVHGVSLAPGPVAVALPGSAFLLALGGLAFAGVRRRRSSSC